MSAPAPLSLDPDDVRGAARVRRLLMAVDGSTRAQQALAALEPLAGAVGVALEVVEVDTPHHRAHRPHLESLARRHRVDLIHDASAAVVVDGLLPLLTPDVLACVATHGRDRSSALLGSVARSLLAQTDGPVLLAGPEVEPADLASRPVLAAVDGTADDPVVAGTAAGWAARLGAQLRLVTVIEPVPAAPDGRIAHRAHGPAEPSEHLETLAGLLAEGGVETLTAVLDDPVAVAPALVAECRRATPALVVVGSRRRGRLRQAVLGDHATQIVHGVPCLVLAVPLGLRR